MRQKLLLFNHMQLLIGWLIIAITVMAGSYIIPGISVDSFTTALVVAVVLGIINIFLKPILLILTLPITILTLGLFALVLNALLIMLAANLVPGFEVSGFWAALLFALLLSVVGWIANSIK